jgi:hypothetical protein
MERIISFYYGIFHTDDYKKLASMMQQTTHVATQGMLQHKAYI